MRCVYENKRLFLKFPFETQRNIFKIYEYVFSDNIIEIQI